MSEPFITDHTFTAYGRDPRCVYLYGRVPCDLPRSKHERVVPPDPRAPASFYWREFDCPRCHAPAGKVCRTPSGEPVPYVHAERDDYAFSAESGNE